jgi:hypothetical protein
MSKLSVLSKTDHKYFITTLKSNLKEIDGFIKSIENKQKKLYIKNLHTLNEKEFYAYYSKIDYFDMVFSRLIDLKNKYRLIDFIKNSKYGTTYYNDFNHLISLQDELKTFNKHYKITDFENKTDFKDFVEKTDVRPLNIQLEELKSTIEAIESNVDVLIDKVDVLEGGDVIEDHEEENEEY